MFKIHNEREKILIKYLCEECTLCSFRLDFDKEINKINAILSSLFMLDIIDKPIMVKNYFEANELKKSIDKYLLEL